MSQDEPIKKRGGRPPSPHKREEHITIYLSKLEKLVMQRRAEKTGLNLSDYGRQMILTGSAQVRLTAAENETLNQVARLGNNLNQIAYKANAEGIRSIAFEAQHLLRQISQLLDKPTEP